MNRMQSAGLVTTLALACSAAWAKIPPPPPLDEKSKAVAEEKKVKADATAESAKKALAEAQDRAVKNYRTHMKKSGKKETRR